VNRRALTINRSPARRQPARPRCPSTDPDRAHARCILDPGHRNAHTADGVDWTDEEIADAS
jgi:hypothetical protein